MTASRTQTLRLVFLLTLPFWLAALVSHRVGATEPGAIVWGNDLARAQTDATSSGRLVWLQFDAPWSYDCNRAERETFVNERVIALAHQKFIAVKLRSQEHEPLARRYGLTRLPASVILDPEGNVLSTIQGHKSPESFVAFLLSTLNAGRQHGAPVAIESPASALALNGFCPVALVEDHRLVPGQANVHAEHGGFTFRLASSQARDTFHKAPERYTPVNRGCCPVAKVDRGETVRGGPTWGVLFDGRLYLCGNAADRAKFLKQPERYAFVDAVDRGFCPHCWATDGQLVRGRSSISLTREGRRFLFPDPTHLEAFLGDSGAVRR